MKHFNILLLTTALFMNAGFGAGDDDNGNDGMPPAKRARLQDNTDAQDQLVAQSVIPALGGDNGGKPPVKKVRFQEKTSVPGEKSAKDLAHDGYLDFLKRKRKEANIKLTEALSKPELSTHDREHFTFILARSYLEENNFDDARAQFNALLAMPDLRSSDKALYHLNFGFVYFKENKFVDALDQFIAAIKIHEKEGLTGEARETCFDCIIKARG